MGYQEKAALLLECSTCLCFMASILPAAFFLFPGLLLELYALGGWQMKRVSAASFALLLSCIRLVGNPGKRSEVMCFSSPPSSRLCQRVTQLIMEASSHDCLLGDSGIHLCLLFELSVSNSTVAGPQDGTVLAGHSAYPTFIFKLSSSILILVHCPPRS